MAIANPFTDLGPANRPAAPRPRQVLHWQQLLLLPVSTAVVLLLWQGLIWVNQYPAFILPPPLRVWERLLRALADGSLLRHSASTMSETLSGLALGLAVAAALGYVLAHWPPLERLLAPYIIASQSIPVAAIAPLIIIWLGSGFTSKALICALIVFFPVLINVIVGVRSVEPDLRDLMRTLRASRWQTFLHLELPAALPTLFAGLKIGATLSVIGAIVGEFSGADRGLGFLISVGRGQLDTALVFVAVFALVLMAMSLYGGVVVLEKVFLSWKD